MEYKKLLVLSEELNSFLNRIHGLYLDSVLGFKVINQKIQKEHDFLKDFLKENPEVSSQEFQDQTTFSHQHLYGNYYAGSGLHIAKQGEVRRRNEIDGENHRLMGNLCIIMFYSYWECYLRDQVAKAYGFLDLNELKDDIWGDFRLLRHAILHNKEKATRELERNAKIIKFFKEGQKIFFSQEQMTYVFSLVLMYVNKLKSDSLPKRSFKIPKIVSKNE